MNTPDDEPAARFVPFMSMGSWMLLALISLFGYVQQMIAFCDLFTPSIHRCVASWTAKPRLVAIYFWSLLVQYIFDMGFLVATIFFCVKASQTAKQHCDSKALQEGFSNVDSLCSAALSLSSILLLVVLGLYKLFSTYALFAIFTFKRWADKESLELAAQKLMQERPQQQWKSYDGDTTRNWSKFED